MAYKIRQCAGCGDEFLPKSSNQQYCGKSVIRKCAICGKSYESLCKKTYNKCCSTKCKNIYAHQQSISSYQNIVKTCVICGKEFTPTNNTQVVCKNQHMRTCVVCGKSFEITLPKSFNVRDIPVTCSKKCATAYGFRNGNPMQNPEVQDKVRSTMLSRYGVVHPMQSDEIKSKVDTTMQQKYGVKRFTQTAEYKDKAIATNHVKYGTDWANQSDQVKDKIKHTNLQKYGVENPAILPEIQRKMSDTYLAKTGYAHPLQNPEVIEKVKQTNQNKYGVDWASSSPEIQHKTKSTMLDKYGVPYALQNGDILNKVKSTNIERYGVENPTQNIEIKNKISNTMLKKYGNSRYSATWEHRETLVTDPTKIEEWKSFLQDPTIYIDNHFDHKPTYKELSETLGVNATSIQHHLAINNQLALVQYTVSYYENDIVSVLKTINPDMQIKLHDRKIIAPLELDIYLPEYALGIEINPTATHNSTYSPYSEGAKSPSYHKHKSDLCEEKGIFLFHIFGYEWIHHQSVIISMLRNLLGKNQNIIYGRKCEIKQIPSKSAYQFLQENHLQGGAYSKINLGLFYADELVSVMTFGKLRSTIGIDSTISDNYWELVRFCNKQNTTVVGGASKLFKFFVDTFHPDTIRSFSNRSHTKGNLYSTLGFKEVRRSAPNYVWVRIADDKAFHRIYAQKRNIQHFLQDDTIDLSMSEKQIMEEHGYAQVFDSGTITWDWSVPN